MTNINMSKPVDNTIMITINDFSFPCHFGGNTAIDLMNKMFEAIVLNRKFSVWYKIEGKEFLIEADEETVIETGDDKVKYSISKKELAKAMLANFQETAAEWIQDDIEIDIFDISDDSNEVSVSESTESNEEMFYDELQYLEEAIKEVLIYHNKTSFDVKVGLAHFNMRQEKNA